MLRRLSLEPFAPAHAEEVVRVIGRVFAEYGMTFDPADFDGDLLDIEGSYEGRGGWFAVLVDEGRVVGTVAAVPKNETSAEMKRLYLLPEYRGQGHGRRLMEHAMARAEQAGHREVVAWSDVRLLTAHKVYDRLGFARIGERRLEDIDKSREYGFALRLAGRQ